MLLDTYPGLAIQSMAQQVQSDQSSASGSASSSRTNSTSHNHAGYAAAASRKYSFGSLHLDSQPGTPLSTASISPHIGPITTQTTPSLVNVVADSEELMFEEQVRVLAVSAAELHNLIQQRKKGVGGGGGGGGGEKAAPVPPPSNDHHRTHTATLQYGNLTADQAHSLTNHLLLNSNLLIQQLTQHWTRKHKHRPNDESLVQLCHDPSPLPYPKEDPCTCRQRTTELNSNNTDSSANPPPSTTTQSAVEATPSSPNPSIPSSVRRTVLPFSNIGLLEKNILGLRTARGTQLRQQQQQLQKQSNSSMPPSAVLQPDVSVHLQSDHGGPDVVHPRDIQLLSVHFAQLLADHLPQQLPTATQTPLSLLHPFGLMIHEFCTQFQHQLQYLQTVNTSTNRPLIAIDRPFLQSQIAAITTFLSSHETLIVLSYPHLYQTTLCKKVLRSTLRASVLNHPSVFTPLWQWYEQIYNKEEEELTVKIDEMKHLELSAMGVCFPYNLNSSSLVPPEARNGEGILGAGASSQLIQYYDDDDNLHDDEEVIPLPPSLSVARITSDEPIDQLIHEHDDGAGERERGTLQAKSARIKRKEIHLPQGATQDDTQWKSTVLGKTTLDAVGAIRRNTSANALSFLSSSPRIPITFPTTQLSTSTSFATPPKLAQPGMARATTEKNTSATTHERGNSDSAIQTSSSHQSTPASSSNSGTLPYSRSIDILSGLDAANTVDAKLDIIVQCCRTITKELNEFLERYGLDTTVEPDSPLSNDGEPPEPPRKLYSITCDDLFQIFAYCLLHAQVSSPVASMNLISDFIEGVQLSGEGGYCMTTMQCAVQLIQNWHPDMVHQPHLLHAQLMASHRPPDIDIADQALPRSYSTRSLSTKTSPSQLTSSNSSATLSASVPISSMKSHANLHASADVSLFAPLLAANLDAFCIAADYLSLDSAWEWLFDKDGVTVYRKQYSGNPIASIKGTSVIHRPPHVIQSFLKNINSRQAVDDLFLGGKILLHLTPETKLVQYRFKARNWCSRQQTDMVLLLHQGVCNDGVTLITLAFSVSHPACPPQPGFQRATVRASGWLFKPIHGGASTHCTYVVSPDGNGFPSWVVNLLSTKQPMLIRNVREYLYSTTTLEPNTPSSISMQSNHSNSVSQPSSAPPSPVVTQATLAARQQAAAVAAAQQQQMNFTPTR